MQIPDLTRRQVRALRKQFRVRLTTRADGSLDADEMNRQMGEQRLIDALEAQVDAEQEEPGTIPNVLT